MKQLWYENLKKADAKTIGLFPFMGGREVKKKLYVSFFCLALMLTLSSISYCEPLYTITQLTHTSFNNYVPDISDNGYVVWSGGAGPSQIFLYDGSAITQLTHDLDSHSNAKVNNSGHVVWECQHDGPSDVYFYDASTITQLTYSGGWFPNINNKEEIVWCGWDEDRDSSDIFIRDDSGVTQITDDSLTDLDVQINDDGYIAWSRSTVHSDEICTYNKSIITQLTDNNFTDIYPHMNKLGHLVWEGSPNGGHSQIFFYNGSTITNLTNNSYSNSTPDINDRGQIVWVSRIDDNDVVSLYDGSQVVQIANSNSQKFLPHIDNNGDIVWCEYVSGFSQIFLAKPIWQREYGAEVNGTYLPGAYLERTSETNPVLADMDYDGDLDMLVGTKEGYIRFYRNDGDSFVPSWVLGSTRYGSEDGLYGGPAISLCDIDDDGDEDIFTGSQDGTIGFYRKEGDSWVHLWDFGPIYVGSYSKPVLCDIDDDGDRDMFIGERYGSIYFYRNDGSAAEPSFVLASSNYESIDAGDRSAPAFCDIDNDNDYDMFIGNSSGKIIFYRNDGTENTPSWTFVSSEYDFLDAGSYSSPDFSDIDADGDYDMFIGNENGDIMFYKNTGTPNLSSWVLIVNYTHIGVDSESVPVFCDIDGDGDYDMFISAGNRAISFYRNDGTAADPSWTFVTDKYNLIEDQTFPMPAFCDIDGDGDYDMFIGNIGGGISFYCNNGTAAEAAWAPPVFNYDNIDVAANSAPAFCDIDNDADYDLFVGNIYGNLYFYRNDGTPSEPQWTLVSDNYGNLDIGALVRPSFGDIDNDGDYDMCIGNERAYYYSYRGVTDFFENTGSPEVPSWEYMVTINYPGYKGAYAAPTLCDIDRDNDADLFVGDGGGYIGFWRNLTVTNTPPETTILSILPNPAFQGDSISFTGTAQDEGDEIAAYKWTSSIDGVLSESALFAINTLSLGAHTITFEAQDSYGVWSEPATAVLEIKLPYELSLKEGEMVSGDVYVNMTYKGTRLLFFQFIVDEKLVNPNPWRTQYFLNGAHTVYGQYPDQINRIWKNTEPITVIANNAISYAPEITAPKDGTEVAGDVTISFRAEGTTPYFAFIVANDKIIGGKILYRQQSPYNFIWKTAKFQNGQYNLKVIVQYLYAGISASKSINVIVNNSIIPTPIINFTCPNPASGTIEIKASSDDDNNFFAPTFYVDGRFIGFKWRMPCGISWDTKKFANGLHTLRFQAYYIPLKKWLVVEKTTEVRN